MKVYARQGGAVIHVEHALNDDVARCGIGLWGAEYLARLVPADERCRRPGCAQGWPADLRAVG